MDETNIEGRARPSRPVAAADAGAARAVTASSAADNDADFVDGDIDGEPTLSALARKRRRGSRGGRGRAKPAGSISDGDDKAGGEDDADGGGDDVGGNGGGNEAGGDSSPVASDPAEIATEKSNKSPAKKARVPQSPSPSQQPARGAAQPRQDNPPRQRQGARAPAELPERISEGRPSAEAAESALVRRPQIGDTRPAPKRMTAPGAAGAESADDADSESSAKKKRRRSTTRMKTPTSAAAGGTGSRTAAAELEPDVLEKRRGRERNGRPIGRYLMCVQVRDNLTQVAVLEGRHLVEHYVSRPADDVSQIHGNIYVGKVQNVLPGMEAAFVDIATPKNAVLYRGDVQYDPEDIVERGPGAGAGKEARIEQILKAKQLIVCQVTKNPIGAKGARLTQEVSLPGRFVVLIPNSKTYGISKRLPDDVRKRLRNILDRVKPAEHGLIVRTAAENASEHELRADMTRLLDQWNTIEAKAKKMQGPGLLYREPELAVRVIREEFNAEYRGVVIDDQRLHDDVRDYIAAFNPELADRVEFYDPNEEGLPIYERFHLHEQLHKALDRKVWLPSGGSLIIEHTEALTVIDVNTGKNVGTSNSNLEATVFHNNLEAADEIARQLRLRDIGGIIVIDFIDMEIRENRRKVVDAFREALARDKTRTQVFDISELGLVEMTRKRIGEGLLTNFADQCPNCDGRGVLVDLALLE